MKQTLASVPPASFGSTFGRALAYTEATHRMQRRKGTSIPYIGHLLGVASLVIDSGGTETEAIGALLHDAAEDQGGESRLDDIRKEFGDDVAAIVAGCSDSLTENPDEKADWLTRKLAYLAHLQAEKSKSVLLVSVCDKTHNLRSMLADYRVVGENLWCRFNKDAGKVGSIRYYRSLLATYEKCAVPDVNLVAVTLCETLGALEIACGAAADSELSDGKGLI